MKPMIGRDHSLGHLIPSFWHSDSWSPQYLLSGFLQTDSEDRHPLCMAPVCLYFSPSVHSLGGTIMMFILKNFELLICVLSRVPGKVRMSSNEIWAEKSGKGECLQIFKCV